MSQKNLERIHIGQDRLKYRLLLSVLTTEVERGGINLLLKHVLQNFCYRWDSGATEPLAR